jgi:hypothetical protein
MPHTLSHDRHFEEKLIDVVGLYLNPPDKAVVLCMDDGSPSSNREINNETLH